MKPNDPHFKRFDTLRARAALAGVVLHVIRNDLERFTFIATRDAVTLELGTLGEVECWAEAGSPMAAITPMEGANA